MVLTVALPKKDSTKVVETSLSFLGGALEVLVLF